MVTRHKSRHKVPVVASVLLCILWTPILQGEDSLSHQDRELMMAAVNIGMSEEQRLGFRDSIAEFIREYRSAMLRISRGHNAIDIDRKMAKKHRSLLGDLDANMLRVLTPVQYQRYEVYRERLAARLTGKGVSDPDAYLRWEFPPVQHH